MERRKSVPMCNPSPAVKTSETQESQTNKSEIIKWNKEIETEFDRQTEREREIQKDNNS